MSEFDEISHLDAPLAEKLETYFARLLGRAPEIAHAYADLIERLKRAGAGGSALAVGDRMINFALPDATGRIVTLEEALAKGPLVLSFNRGHWCSFCRLELLALSAIEPDLRARNIGLISITPETARHTSMLAAELDLHFPILTDIDNGVALTANLMIALGASLTKMLHKSGTDLAGFHGNAAGFLPIPATYIVAQSGEIVAAYVDPDFRNRMATDDIFNALDQLAV